MGKESSARISKKVDGGRGECRNVQIYILKHFEKTLKKQKNYKKFELQKSRQ